MPDLDPNRSQRPRRPLNPRTLPNLLWAVLQEALAGRDVAFTEDHPKAAVTGPRICWSVVSRLPGRPGVTELKPRLRETLADPAGHEVQRYAQWHTLRYRFDVYAASNAEAGDLSEELENLLFSITPLLQQVGVDEFLFDQEFHDAQLAGTREDVYVRSLQYLCVLERTYIKVTPVLQEAFLRLVYDPADRWNREIVRSPAQAVDLLPDPWVQAVYAASDAYQQTLDTPGDYVQGVDFEIARLEDGRSYLRWLEGRAHPAPGGTYFLSYQYMAEQRTLAL